MFDIFNPKDPALDEAIASVYTDLKGYTAETDEHKAALSQLTELYALRKGRVDPNKLLEIAANIAVAVAVLKYEQTGVITTKLFQFLGKMR